MATTFSIAATDAVKLEGDSGSTPFTFTITRSGDPGPASSIQWSLAGTGLFPVNADDFVGGVLPSGTADFAAGIASVQITVNVAGDTLPGPDETFAVTISNPENGEAISQATASGIILNDDGQTFLGTPANNVINLSKISEGTILDLSQGGDDTVTGSSGPDTIVFRPTEAGANTFSHNDHIDGKDGIDVVALVGDYSSGITLMRNTLVNVEDVIFGDGYSYKMTTVDPTIAANATMQFDARELTGINSVTINGAAETNGHFAFLGGAGNDTFIGGRASDLFVGGAGADRMTGNNGADTFVYEAAKDSPLVVGAGNAIQVGSTDTLVNFQAGLDLIDLSAFGLAGKSAALLTSSAKSFTSIAAPGNTFFATAGLVAEYAKVGSTPSARLYVDLNQDGSLNAGDVMIQMTGVARGGLNPASLII